MPLDALGLALAAAVLHAGWNVLLHGSDDVEARTAGVLSVAVIVFAPVAAATWSVQRAVIPYVVASVAFETVYFALLVAAYRRRDLSVVYPVARGSAPVLVLLGSAVVLGSAVSAGEAIGVCAVAAGVLLVRGVRQGAAGLPIALAIGCSIAGYTLVDKQGLHHASPIPYLELTMTPVAILAVANLVIRRGVAPLRAQAGWTTVVAGVGSFSAYCLFLFALRLAPAPGVAAVRETSVVFAAGLAALFLHERVTATRAVGAAVVAGGVALLALS
ncbi:MAG TPA: EamA family transporter [Gaiellaceae bacterium]|nr:EamA family transporter [Gaiellaceae bacterium]